MKPDKLMPLGMDENGLAHPLRTDPDGRLELVLSGGRQMLRHGIGGTLSAAAGVLRYPNRMGETLTITDVWLNVSTQPTGAAILVDVNLNGVTIFASSAHRPQIAAGAFSGGSSAAPLSVAWPADAYLTFDIDQVGSGAAGADLVVTLVYG